MEFAQQPQNQDKEHRKECLGIVPGKVEGPGEREGTDQGGGVLV